MAATAILWTRTRFTPALQAIIAYISSFLCRRPHTMKRRNILQPWKSYIWRILGDPGADSWAGRKGATKVFKHCAWKLLSRLFSLPDWPPLVSEDAFDGTFYQVPHWGKKEKTIGVGENKNQRGTQERGKGAAISPLPRTPFFSFFSHCGAWTQAYFTWNDWLPRTSKREIFDKVLFNRVTLRT